MGNTSNYTSSNEGNKSVFIKKLLPEDFVGNTYRWSHNPDPANKPQESGTHNTPYFLFDLFRIFHFVSCMQDTNQNPSFYSGQIIQTFLICGVVPDRLLAIKLAGLITLESKINDEIRQGNIPANQKEQSIRAYREKFNLTAMEKEQLVLCLFNCINVYYLIGGLLSGIGSAISVLDRILFGTSELKNGYILPQWGQGLLSPQDEDSIPVLLLKYSFGTLLRCVLRSTLLAVDIAHLFIHSAGIILEFCTYYWARKALKKMQEWWPADATDNSWASWGATIGRISLAVCAGLLIPAITIIVAKLTCGLAPLAAVTLPYLLPFPSVTAALTPLISSWHIAVVQFFMNAANSASSAAFFYGMTALIVTASTFVLRDVFQSIKNLISNYGSKGLIYSVSQAATERFCPAWQASKATATTQRSSIRTAGHAQPQTIPGGRNTVHKLVSGAENDSPPLPRSTPSSGCSSSPSPIVAPGSPIPL